MREAFKRISGEDDEIDAYELQDILNAAFMRGKRNIVCKRNQYESERKNREQSC